MFGHGGHSWDSAPSGVTILTTRKTTTPFLQGPVLASLLKHGGESRIPRGDELGAVIEGCPINAPTRHPTSYSAAFVDDKHT